MNNHSLEMGTRHRFELIFRSIGLIALLSTAALLVLLISVVSYRGFSALWKYEIELQVNLQNFIERDEDTNEQSINYYGALASGLEAHFPQATSRNERKALMRYIPSAYAETELAQQTNRDLDSKQTIQTIWINLSDQADDFLKTGATTMPETLRQTIQKLLAENKIRKTFNTEFFTQGDSREPEHAGIYAALIGSLWLMLVSFMISFPVGLGAALYLQEFAPKNRWSSFIEININNLASVPSIIFGLMGLAFFLNWLGLPRGSPLVGGMVLSLMTLPTIIIATRAALASVPPSIREAALAVGASHMQSVFHHVFPLALPGILTGTIIGMARALGETAPLLMVGMLAFIADTPQNITDPASVLPVQIYIWADSPEPGFADKASAAIIILLLFLISVNALAVLLRRHFFRRW